MKKIFFLACIGLFTLPALAQENKKVAILEVIDREGKLEYAEKLMLRSNLARAVTNIEGYEAYNRADLDAILSEHDFQRSGNVSESEIKKIGEMTGAAYILLAEGAKSRDNKIFVTAQIINVETTQIEVTDNKLVGTSSDDMVRGCRSLAGNMFGSLAGASTSTNKFINLFKGKPKSAEQQKADSIAASKKKAQAEIAAANKAAQREQAEKIRKERAEAQKQAQAERRQAKEQAAKEEAERAKYYITKISNNEYEYLGTVMDRKAYAGFLQNNCPTAFSHYKKGQKLIGAGWGLFSTGLALTAGGTALWIVSPMMDPDTESILSVSGISLMSAGGAMTLISIPVLGTGYGKRNKANKVYNNKCASSEIQPLTLNIKAGPQSLGLALNF